MVSLVMGIGFTVGKQSSRHEVDEKVPPKAKVSALLAAHKVMSTSPLATNCMWVALT
nr:hypothetical protein [Proteus mirabilis]